MEKTIVLIDAGFLSKLSKYFGAGKYLVYDLVAFSKNLAEKQNLNCERIYYYTSPPFQSDKPIREEAERYNRYKKFKDELLKTVSKYVRLTKEDFDNAPLNKKEIKRLGVKDEK